MKYQGGFYYEQTEENVNRIRTSFLNDNAMRITSVQSSSCR